MKRTLLVMALACLVASPAAAQRSEVPGGGPSWLPDSTILLVNCPDLGSSLERLKGTSLHALWSEPAIQNLYKKLREFIESQANRDKGFRNLEDGFKKAVGISLLDLPRLFRGHFTLALCGLDFKGKQPKVDVVLSFGVGKSEETLKKLVGFVEETLAKQKVKIERAMHGKAQVSSVAVGDGITISWTVNDGKFLLTSQAERMKDILRRQASGDSAGTLASDKDYQAFESRVSHDGKHEALFYLNVKALLAGVKPMIEQKIGKILDALGVYTFTSVGGGVSIDGKGIREVFHIGMTEQRKGISTLLTFPASQRKVLRFIPKGVSVASAGSYDFKRLYDEIHTAVAAIDAGAKKKMDGAIADLEKKSGIKIADFAASIGQEMGGYYRIEFDPQKVGPDGVDLQVVVVLEMKNADVFRKGVGSFLEVARAKGAQVKNHKGHQVHTYQIKTGARPLVIAYSIGDDFAYVSFGTKGDELLNLIDRKTEGTLGLAKDARFTATLSALKPPEGSAIGYVDLGGLLVRLYEWGLPALKKQLQKGQFPVRPEDLPESAVLRRHLWPMAGFVHSHDRGMTATYYSPVGYVTLAVAGVGVVAAVAIPALTKAKLRAQGAACLSRLRMIGMALQQYRIDHGKYPETLEEMVTGKKLYLFGGRQSLICPTVAKARFASTYLYVYDEKLGGENASETIVAYENVGHHGGFARNVLFLDNSVRTVPEFQFRRLFKAQAGRLAKHGVRITIWGGKGGGFPRRPWMKKSPAMPRKTE